MDSDATRRFELHLAACRYLPGPMRCSGTGIQKRAIYRYFSIPQQTFEELLRAESKGGYFNARIRNRFAYAKVYSAGAQPQIRDSYANRENRKLTLQDDSGVY